MYVYVGIEKTQDHPGFSSSTLSLLAVLPKPGIRFTLHIINFFYTQIHSIFTYLYLL